ncbi:MAG: hypothetical protein AB8G16_13415 [Gammaproteobacteria bacterium]
MATPAGTAPLTFVLVIIGIALLVQMWRVLKSARSTKQRALVLAANVLYATALAAFLVPPTFSAPADNVVILTAPTSDANVRRALRARQALALGTHELKPSARRHIKTVPDFSAARAVFPEASKWRVLGAGLPPSANVTDLAFDFDAPPKPSGVRDATWPQTLRTGERLVVTGTVIADMPEALVVSLLDPSGTVADTAQPDAEGHFALAAPTKAAGSASFALRVTTDADSVLEEVPLPVDIRTPEPLRILVRAGAPSFEIRYLKDWARRSGAKMVIDTTLSRDKTRRETINIDEVFDAPFDDTLLSEFDLLILEARSFDALSATQLNALQNTAQRTGLGLIVLGTSDAQRMANFQGPASSDGVATSVAVSLPGASGTQVGTSARFVDNQGDVMLRALTGEALAKRTSHNNQNLVVSLIDDSHRWITAGQPDTHAAYWNALIDGAVSSRAPIVVTTEPRHLYAHQRAVVCLRGADDRAAAMQAIGGQSVTLQLTAVATRPGERCALTYPGSGWHSVRVDERDIARLFVFSAEHWAVRQHVLATEFTRRVAARGAPQNAPQVSAETTWPRWPFALLSLLLAATLWFEQRRFAL